MSSSGDPALLDFLRSIALFGGLSDDSLRRIEPMLVPCTYEPGCVICAEGEAGRAMFVVRHGEVEVQRSSTDGAAVPIVRLGPGEFFGEMSLIEIQRRSATVKVIEPALLYSMTNRDLYALYGQDLDAYILVLQNICRQLARRLRKSDSRLSDLLAIMQKHTGDDAA
jgi:CRP/FNR family transcriptional regulator, cyclic AMP receptor protein